MASAGEVDDFIDHVDEVSRLINGLAAGTIPPDYVDRKVEQRQREQEAASAGAKGRPALPPGSRPQPPSGCDVDSSSDADCAVEEEARQAGLMRKVGHHGAHPQHVEVSMAGAPTA